ncbi:MAG: GMC family oxidoreductase [Alphaproteobacteria bacterium]
MIAPHIAIIGSGVAACAVAQRLLERKIAGRVTLFEAGNAVKMADQRHWLDYLTTNSRPYDENGDARDQSDEGSSKFLRGSRLFVRGGSTVHWGGWSLRFKPEDFALASATGQAIDWPFGYETLEPYYHLAEQFLTVAGDSASEDPPRQGKKYPLEAVPYTIKDGPVAKTLDSLGYGYSHLPIARNWGCVTTGTCKYCPVNGRYTAVMTLQEMEDSFGAAIELRTESPVRRIIMRDKKTALSVEYIEKGDGDVKFFSADRIIIAAGAIESPKLLLNSQSGFWPVGIGNDFDHLGRHLVFHPLVWAKGRKKNNPDHLDQELDFPTLGCRHFDSPAEQKRGKFFFVRDGRGTAASFQRDMSEGKSVADIEKKLQSELPFSLHGFIESFEPEENRVSLTSETTRFGLPGTKITLRENDITTAGKKRFEEVLARILREMGCSSIEAGHYPPRGDHSVATCRMSVEEKDGVVDANLKIHGTDNLYVCSNAVIPNVAAVNPTLTLTALALRLGDSL